MKTIQDLYRRHRGKFSDKWELYLSEYERLFEAYRNEYVSILEIGIQNGGSLEIWAEYFIKSRVIVGCDIDSKCSTLHFDDPRIIVITGDASLESTGHEIFQCCNAFDIIIDDGAHTSEAIVKSFAQFFPHLKENGVYVVEDLHCSYWQEFSGGIHYPFSAMAFFKRLADLLNHEHWGIDCSKPDFLSGFSRHCVIDFSADVLDTIHSIEFINSLCIIKKSAPHRNRLGNRIVAGLEESITSGLAGLSGRTSPVSDQTTNPWSASSGTETDSIELLTRHNMELNKRLAEAQDQIQDLSRTILDRDAERSAHLEQLRLAEAEKAKLSHSLALLESELIETHLTLDQVLHSRAWLLTAPYRYLGNLVKSGAATLAQTGLLLRVTTGLCLLPAAFELYGGLAGCLSALRTESHFFGPVLNAKSQLVKQIEDRPRFYRRFVLLPYAFAVRLHRSGSVSRSLGNLISILRRQGVDGLRSRLMATVSSLNLSASILDQDVSLSEIPAETAHRILVADYRIPRTDVSAGERATVGILGDLRALGFEVVFLPADLSPSTRYEPALRSLGVELITRRSGYTSATEFITEQGHRFGIFYLIRVDVAELLLPSARAAAPMARIIFHAPDLYFLREFREAELYRNEALRNRALLTRDRELAIMRNCDAVVVVSPAEIPVIRAELPDARIAVFPVLYAPVVENPNGFEARRHIFFLGGFGHPPNVDAVKWFAEEIWPLIRAKLPDTEFHIVGAEAPPEVLNLERLAGIRVIGFAADLDPLFATYRVGVAPIRFGAGIKGKVAMTLGAGIPCVCSRMAAEGMGITNDIHAPVEDDPQRFADAVVKLYTDASHWKRLSDAGRNLVRNQFSNIANRSALFAVLNQARALPLDLFSAYCHRSEPRAVPPPSKSTSIDISIIVPAYNKWDLTRACLTSVIHTTIGCDVSYELILADDGSSDATIRAAELFPGLRVIRTPKNLGFLRNCNHAAREARGRYLLFLNNDTVVLPGWLMALYQTLEEDPSAAIVGSKLLYPDEHIQEAGGGLLANGEGVSIGRWLWQGKQHLPVRRYEPLFNIPRETDYVSGASFLVRRSFWDAVGGFDQRYAPAYCEDSDLAMSARAMGLKVLYQPDSEVLHFEHQTYAADSDANSDALHRRNNGLLVDKWHDVLERQHLPMGSSWYRVAAHGERAIPPAICSRRRSGQLNILYFSPFPSHPANHGNQATIQQFGQRFQSLGHRVHFALLRSAIYTPQDEQAMRDAWDTLDILPNDHPLAANGQTIPFDGWYEEGLGERIRLLCHKYEIDVVFCSYVFQSKLLEFVPAYILKIIDTHDKMGNRYEMLRRNGQPLEFFSCTPEEEGAYLRRADIVVARRAEEARYFNEVTGRDNAIVIPHVEPPHFIHRTFGGLRNVGIVASANRINLAIVRECLEALGRRFGKDGCPFTVHIAGQVKDLVPSLAPSDAAIFDRSWVRMHGFIEDIAEFYRGLDLVLSPVTMGTGINVKTVQAMAYGMPLLTTAWGSKGIESTDALHNLPDLDALAGALLPLLDNPSELNRLAATSRERYQRFYEESIESFRRLLTHPLLLGKAIGDENSPAACLSDPNTSGNVGYSDPPRRPVAN